MSRQMTSRVFVCLLAGSFAGACGEGSVQYQDKGDEALGRAPDATVGPTSQQSNGQLAIATFGSITNIASTAVLPVSVDAEGNLIINGTAGNDVATVSILNSQVQVTLNGYSRYFSTSSVKKVLFYGGAGADTFTNATAYKAVAHGGAGADTLTGGSNADVLYGDEGNDTLYGGPGRDTLYGGPGNDRMYGQAGQDVLVAVGLGYDTLVGGSQWDEFWAGIYDTISDASANELSLGYVHRIPAFLGVSYSSADNVPTPIGLDPVGEDLPDPVFDLSLAPLSIGNFSDSPLFASTGPSKEDVFQGSIGDCYLMSRLSSLADASGETIRKLVVALGDGSYAVRFYRDGKEVYVRVDGDLWIDNTNTPKFAKLGKEGSIWVPIVEKAFAIFRKNWATYTAIAGGDGKTPGYLGVTDSTYTIDDGVTAQDVIDWYNSGSPDGALKSTIQTGVYNLLYWIKAQRDARKPLITGARSGVRNTTPIQLDTYRRGQHIYMVDHVLTDAWGTPTGLVLRDPYGLYRTITDFTRIYFCIGRAIVSTT